MHPVIKIVAVVGFVVLYALGTYFYEVKVMTMGVGWWAELIVKREVWSPVEALWYFIWVTTTTFLALPHIAWAPVYLIKELVYLFRCYERSKPYTSKPYMRRIA